MDEQGAAAVDTSFHCLPATVFAALGTWVVQRTRSGTLVGFGPAPAWWVDLFGSPLAAGDLTSHLRTSHFLGSFLADAEEFWHCGHPGTLASGTWQEGGADTPPYHLEATALCADEHHLLLISLLGVAGQERQQVIQKAREGALRHHRDEGEHRGRENLLQRQQAELERRVAARTAELQATNQELSDQVSERLLAETRLRASLEQVEALLREVHHRVKNNMQVITSLLNLQADRVSDAAAQRVLMETYNRVQSMALAHERAYRSGDLSSIELGQYIQSLVQGLQARSPELESATVRISVAPISLDISRVVSLGLLLNELLTGALGHSAQPGEARIIDVEVPSPKNEHLTLVLRDSGHGLLGRVAPVATDSLEAQLTATLVSQLGGRASAPQPPGSEWKMVFKP
jgi:two-component sensor histidine kinase